MDKKILAIVAAVLVVVGVGILLGVAICGGSDKNVEGELDVLMSKLYEGIPEDELPMLATSPVTQENVEYFLGTSDIEYKEALASEPLMSSIAHSVVLVRTENADQAEEVKEKIKANVNPVKWICVSVDPEHVKVERRGNLVVLIMDNEKAETMLENFNNL